MPFPKKGRVIFAKNPLTDVICQLRFPSILKIDTEVPAKFQDKIRDVFPNFTESSAIKIEPTPDPDENIPAELVRKLIKTTSAKNYEFSTDDGNWKVNLTRDFIAFTSKKYEKWESFKEKLALPLNSFIDIYNASHFSRIGLRYIDVIERSLLGLENDKWRDLLNLSLLGLLSDKDIGDDVQNFESTYNIALPNDKGVVRILTRFVLHRDSGEQCYRIDSDFFETEKTSIDNVLTKLEFFNKQASKLIQWSISEKLSNAMEPQSL